MALLQVENLQVNYGPIQAVKGINLNIEKKSGVAYV
jgi:ABC-type branched-subunit amino acid transport system ATPase component